MSTAETQRRGENKKIGPAPAATRGLTSYQEFVRGADRGNLRLAPRTRFLQGGVPSAASARELRTTAQGFEAFGETGNLCLFSASQRLCGEWRTLWKS